MCSQRLKQTIHRRSCKTLSVLMTFAMLLPGLTMDVSANGAVYEGTYSIHNAIAYAQQYAYSFNGQYEIAYAVVETSAGKRTLEEDCTNFVSQCLLAGGIPSNEAWNGDSSHWTFVGKETYPDLYDSSRSNTVYRGYSDGYTTFVNAGWFNRHFTDRGYLVERSVEIAGEALSINDLRPAVGDVIQFDWEGDGIIDYTMICCGYQANEGPCFAGHSGPAFMKPFSQIQSTRPFTYSPALGHASGTVVYLIHMTDTAGLTDITSRYQAGQVVAIRSGAVGQYISSNTDRRGDRVDAVADRDAAGTWELFKIEKNRYGEVGFRSLGNGNFLSARVDRNDRSAPLQAAFGWDYQDPLAWESFRIFERDGLQYIQSQANGKWVQVDADKAPHQVRASAGTAGTWEQFSIEIVPASAGADPAGPNIPPQAAEPPVPPSTAEPPAPALPAANWVDHVYYANGYNEGIYTGEWANGKPDGQGTLEYEDRNGDGLFYDLRFGTQIYRARSYEGHFKDGYRDGQGTVVYEGGYRMTGTYYGRWQAGKTVFEGSLHYPDGTSLDCRMVCTDGVSANLIRC